MHRIAFIVFSAGLVTTAVAGPRAGQIDPTFGEAGIARHAFDLELDGADRANAFAEDANGRLYLAGEIANGVEGACLGVTRFSPNGKLDKSYASGGAGCVNLDPAEFGSNITVHDAKVRADGTLVVVVAMTENGNVPLSVSVCHFSEDGKLDLSFNKDATPGCKTLQDLDAGIYATFKSIHLETLENDAIVILNQLTGIPAVVRIGENGNIKPIGGSDFLALQPAAGMYAITGSTMTPQKSLLLLGQYVGGGGGAVAVVLNLDPLTGEPTLDFGENGVFLTDEASGWVATSAAFDSKGSILVTTALQASSGYRPAVLKLSSKAEADVTFNDGKALLYDPCKLMVQGCSMVPSEIRVTASGFVVVAGTGEFTGSKQDMWVFRLQSDGQPDANFGASLLAQTGFARVNISKKNDSVSGMAINGERVVLGGTMDIGDVEANADFALVRLADGSIFGDGLESHP